MVNLSITSSSNQGISKKEIREALEKSLKGQGRELKKVLLIPPDLTRAHSGAGDITRLYYDILKDDCQVNIMPALGTHMAMTHDEIDIFFESDIPKECFINHNWRKDVVKIGQVPGEYVREISEGLVDDPIDIEINRTLLDKSYDLIISIGQVVPHEVVGMANYSKNIFVGCGGIDIINKSHMLGAVFGMERIMGKDHSPVRKVFDYCEENFIKDIPLMYVLTVTTNSAEGIQIHGSSDGRFCITYAPGHLTRQEVEGVNYSYIPLEEALEKYNPSKLKDGFNILEDGEEIFYISNPALGLWADRSKF